MTRDRILVTSQENHQMTKEQETVVYRVNAPKDLWEDFKAVTPKSMTMNDAILCLISEKVNASKPIQEAE